MDFIKDVQWGQVASFLTALTLVLALLGPKLKPLRKFIGTGVQEMFGITDLRKDLADERADRIAMHEENQSQFKEVHDEIKELTDKQDQHIKDTKAHNGGGG